jgi:hypothetical protein
MRLSGWSEAVKERLASGQTVTEFCESKGISQTTYYYRQKKVREDGKPAQSKSYMWLYRTSGVAERQIVLYDYQPDRRYIHPETFLKNFSGFLHADGYEGTTSSRWDCRCRLLGASAPEIR